MTEKHHDPFFYRYVHNYFGTSCNGDSEYVLVIKIWHGPKSEDSGVVNYSYCFVSPEDFESSHKDEIKEILSKIKLDDLSEKTRKYYEKYFGKYLLFSLEGKFSRLTKDGAKKEIEKNIADGKTYSVEVKVVNGKVDKPLTEYIVEDMKNRKIKFPSRWTMWVK